MKCIVCGIEKGCSKDRFEKLVTKYGSVEQLAKSYKCRTCRKL